MVWCGMIQKLIITKLHTEVNVVFRPAFTSCLRHERYCDSIWRYNIHCHSGCQKKHPRMIMCDLLAVAKQVRLWYSMSHVMSGARSRSLVLKVKSCVYVCIAGWPQGHVGVRQRTPRENPGPQVKWQAFWSLDLSINQNDQFTYQLKSTYNLLNRS